jgi:putative molybdopterin biosynthesis protein
MDDIATALRTLARQEQFLDVVDRDEAVFRFQRHLKLRPLGSERVPLSQALGRVLARAIVAEVDVPGFDRASVDGFALRADDTVDASERAPRTLTVNREILTPGKEPQFPVTPGTTTLIATGGMVPRGADAVVMVEHTEALDSDERTLIEVRRPMAAGQFIAFAGSDLARGETVLRAGQVLTSREIGMLAAVGCAVIEVWRKPRVAIISTGDEIVAPGEPIAPGAVYDSNAAILAAAGGGSGWHRVPARHRSRRRGRIIAPPRRRARIVRHGDPLRRHVEGRRRSLLSRRRPFSRPRDRRARRRAEAG